jgi:hypothetical protein
MLELRYGHDMGRGIAGRRALLYLIAALTLLLGTGSAVLIYINADNNPDRVLGYEVVGGKVYPVAPEDSKVYMHDLELYGGKANVLADEFIGWFNGLWHGRSLAVVMACLAVIVSTGFFFAANHLRSGPGTDSRGEDNSP